MDRAKELGDEARERIRALFSMIEAQEAQQKKTCPSEAHQQQISSPVHRDQHRPPHQQVQESAQQAPFPKLSPRLVEARSEQESAQQAPLPKLSPRLVEARSEQEFARQAPFPKPSPRLGEARSADISARHRAEELGIEMRERIKNLYQAIEEFKVVQHQCPISPPQHPSHHPTHSPQPHSPRGYTSPHSSGRPVICTKPAMSPKEMKKLHSGGYPGAASEFQERSLNPSPQPHSKKIYGDFDPFLKHLQEGHQKTSSNVELLERAVHEPSGSHVELTERAAHEPLEPSGTHVELSERAVHEPLESIGSQVELTERAAHKPPKPSGTHKGCTPGTSFMADCNKCHCNKQGRSVCTKTACPDHSKHRPAHSPQSHSPRGYTSPHSSGRPVISTKPALSPKEMKKIHTGGYLKEIYEEFDPYFCPEYQQKGHKKTSSNIKLLERAVHEPLESIGSQVQPSERAVHELLEPSGSQVEFSERAVHEPLESIGSQVELTERAAHKPPKPSGTHKGCTPGTSFMVDCNKCHCNEQGRSVCTKMACPEHSKHRPAHSPQPHSPRGYTSPHSSGRPVISTKPASSPKEKKKIHAGGYPKEIYEDFDPYFCPERQRKGHQKTLSNIKLLERAVHEPLESIGSQVELSERAVHEPLEPSGSQVQPFERAVHELLEPSGSQVEFSERAVHESLESIGSQVELSERAAHEPIQRSRSHPRLYTSPHSSGRPVTSTKPAMSPGEMQKLHAGGYSHRTTHSPQPHSLCPTHLPQHHSHRPTHSPQPHSHRTSHSPQPHSPRGYTSSPKKMKKIHAGGYPVTLSERAVHEPLEPSGSQVELSERAVHELSGSQVELSERAMHESLESIGSQVELSERAVHELSGSQPQGHLSPVGRSAPYQTSRSPPKEIYEEFDPYFCPEHQQKGNQKSPSNLGILQRAWDDGLEPKRLLPKGYSTPTSSVVKSIEQKILEKINAMGHVPQGHLSPVRRSAPYQTSRSPPREIYEDFDPYYCPEHQRGRNKITNVQLLERAVHEPLESIGSQVELSERAELESIGSQVELSERAVHEPPEPSGTHMVCPPGTFSMRN